MMCSTIGTRTRSYSSHDLRRMTTSMAMARSSPVRGGGSRSRDEAAHGEAPTRATMLSARLAWPMSPPGKEQNRRREGERKEGVVS